MEQFLFEYVLLHVNLEGRRNLFRDSGSRGLEGRCNLFRDCESISKNLSKMSWIGENSQTEIKNRSSRLSIFQSSLAIRGTPLAIFAEPCRLTISSFRVVCALPTHVARPRTPLPPSRPVPAAPCPTGAAYPHHSLPRQRDTPKHVVPCTRYRRANNCCDEG